MSASVISINAPVRKRAKRAGQPVSPVVSEALEKHQMTIAMILENIQRMTLAEFTDLCDEDLKLSDEDLALWFNDSMLILDRRGKR